MSSSSTYDNERTYNSPPRHSVRSRVSPVSKTLPTGGTSGLGSTERRHYNRALKELCRILRLDGRRLDESGLAESELTESRATESRVTESELVDGEDSSWTRAETMKHRLQENGSSNDEHNDTISDIPHRGHHVGGRSPKPSSCPPSLDLASQNIADVEVVKNVYAELSTINRKLQRESAVLHVRELAVAERERLLDNCHVDRDQSLHEAHREVARRFAVLKEQHQDNIAKLTDQLQDKTKENKRLKTSFETLKQANDDLRKQLTDIQERNRTLESQAANLHSRLANLQRKHELADRQRALHSMTTKAKSEAPKENADVGKAGWVTKQNAKTAAVYDVLGFLLEWLSEAHLQTFIMGEDCTKESPRPLPTPTVTRERCTKVLPALAEILHCPPSHTARMHLPCLQFIYWALLHLDQGQQQQRNPLSSTYRRLGEELYKPSVVRFADATRAPDSLNDRENPAARASDCSQDRPRTAVFFRSPSLHTRLLSCLIILKTLTQVDNLAQVFDVLRMDLKEDTAKELFLRYHATQVIVPFLKMTNKTLMVSAVDVFLQMSMESALTSAFLDSCSNDSWFRACATMLRTPKLDPKIWEKLSIILQKLSKIRTNKRHFEVQGITGIVQDVIRSAGQDNAFLSLNLRSILFNFNIAKKQSSS